MNEMQGGSPSLNQHGIGNGNGFFNSSPKLNVDDLIMNTKMLSPKASPYGSDVSSDDNSESMSMSQYSQTKKDRPSFFQKSSDAQSEMDEGDDDEYVDDTQQHQHQHQQHVNNPFVAPQRPVQSFFQQDYGVPKVDTTQKKREMLYQFDRLEKKGVPLPRKFTMSDTLEEIEQEYERLKKEREVDASIKFQRKILTAFTGGVEYLNSKFDPFSVNLDGCSESISENINDYDEIFEDLHEKYKTKSMLPPEILLVFISTIFDPCRQGRNY
jgi:hypothetical protein